MINWWHYKGDAVGKLAFELKRHDLCLINPTLRIDIHLEQ